MLDEFQELGIQFISLHDQIDLTTAAGRLMLHILASFAEFERSLIRERTILGLNHARAKGRRLGRPRTRNEEAIRALRSQGLSYAAIQSQLGVSRGAVCRSLKSDRNRLQNF
jgi:DNA invertase Pin-like site-specific DNA recombinase